MKFTRPSTAPAPVVRLRRPAPASPAVWSGRPRPDWGGTCAALFSVALAFVSVALDRPSAMAQLAAVTIGAGLGVSLLCDLRHGGLRNLIRTDVMMILSFYFLTLFEFLFPQEVFNVLTNPKNTAGALSMVFIAFAGLLLGRHLWRPARQPLEQTMTREIPARWLVVIFWITFCLGFLHQWIAVQFDPVLWVEWMTAPRFSQPWSRSRLGDWKALLVEMGMLLYLLPPIAAIAFARRQRYSRVIRAGFGAALAVLFFSAFAGGTRNVLAAYLVTFMIAHAFACPRERAKETWIITAVCSALLLAATVFMLNFRNIGLKDWWLGRAHENLITSDQTLFVDYNLFSMTALADTFPARQPFIGLELPYLALIRPIPRALWPEKPEGLSSSIESAVGAEGNYTVAASFAGEAYMAGGLPVVFLCALFFGALAGWWNHFASPKNSELGILIYASGFFAAVISMRSIFVFTTALLPTMAAIALSAMAVRKLAERARAWAARTASPAPRPAWPAHKRPPLR